MKGLPVAAAFRAASPEFGREPTVAIALCDGNVRWMIQAAYTPVPDQSRALLVEEMVPLCKPTWMERIAAERGAARAEELVGALP